MYDKLLSQLNPEQAKAVTTVDGPLLVLAGAGTGKTRVITFRIAYMLSKGIKPENILGMTFTNKAAKEMKARLAALVPKEDAQKVTLGTFHSFCAKILRKEIRYLNFTPNFSIIDSSDQKGIIRQAEAELGYSKEDLPVEFVLSVMGNAKNSMLAPDELIESSDYEQNIKAAKVYKRYQKILQNQNMLDFDDMLLFVYKIWDEKPDILEKYREIYQYLLVDEYQDTNRVQFQLIKMLAGKRMNLCVVGDDDQSIYGWRGAVVDNILKFPEYFHGTSKIKLEQNYRSTNKILSSANSLISGNSNRYDKKLWSAQKDGENLQVLNLEDSEAEAKFIADAIYELAQRNREFDYCDVAVLYRSNHLSQLLEQNLRQLQIPFRVVGGQEFFSRKEVKDAAAYLKLILNPKDDQSLLRILSVPPRGIGDKAIQIMKDIQNTAFLPFTQILQHTSFVEKVASRAANGAAQLSDCIDKYTKLFSQPGNLASKVFDYLEETGYYHGLQKIYKNISEAHMRQENVQAFIDSIARFEEKFAGKPYLSDFMESFALLDENDKTDKNAPENSVTLMSIHASKGLEFTCVFVIGMEEGLFPHERSLKEGNEDEERRLFYVAVTRAKERLILTHANRRIKFSRRLKKRIAFAQKRSKFLKELPEKHLDNMSRNDFFKPMDKDELNQQFEDIFALLGDD